MRPGLHVVSSGRVYCPVVWLGKLILNYCLLRSSTSKMASDGDLPTRSSALLTALFLLGLPLPGWLPMVIPLLCLPQNNVRGYTRRSGQRSPTRPRRPRRETHHPVPPTRRDPVPVSGSCKRSTHSSGVFATRRRAGCIYLTGHI